MLADKVIDGSHLSSRSQNAEIHGRALSEKVRYEMLIRLGYFVTESSEHFSEYVPWFIKQNRPDLIKKFEIPLDEYIDRCEASIEQWKDYEKAISKESQLETFKSNEYASEIIKAKFIHQPVKIYGNVSNKHNLIPNLPNDCCVEVPCIIDGKGIHPQVVDPLPLHLVSLIQTNINVQKLTVEAIIMRKKENVYHAAMLDPLTSSQLSTDEIWNLVDELILAHGNYIPKLY